MIIVIGVGADGMSGLAETSRNELRRATIIYGSKRQIDLLDDTVAAPRRQWPSPMLPALETLEDRHAEDIHVVASGDPLLHGIGGTLIRLYGPDKVRVLPHVSSVTLACARMGWNAHETEVISLVTAPPPSAVRRGGQSIVLSKSGSTPKELATLLDAHGRGDSTFIVLENLGGPTERRRDGTARQWAEAPPDDVDDLNVIAIRYLPDERLSPLPDDAFVHDGQITKHGIRAVTLAALAPRPDERLWDVGAGSGSISVEWCLSWSGCSAAAFERDERRRHNIAFNAAAFGASASTCTATPRGRSAVSSRRRRSSSAVASLSPACSTHASPACRPAAASLPTRSPRNPKRCWRSRIRVSVVSSDASSTTTVNRSAASPDGARRCRLPSGR